MLPLRPNANYDSWLALTAKVAMPMLLQLRQSLGFGTTVRTNPAGDWYSEHWGDLPKTSVTMPSGCRAKT
jgi:hypothetical protein